MKSKFININFTIKRIFSYLLIFFLSLIYKYIQSKKISKNKINKVKEKENLSQINNISINPQYTYENSSTNPKLPNMEYHLLNEDQTKKPIIRYPYEDPHEVKMKIIKRYN